ncbi:unnamed protein product [Notodromas monacha]|uniref:Uncharacterized protein n=1 Tax=Notodromas monacha TaxID=399045 RepID=A0A7R9BH96_9CRUS|nr:unnamed protein product [Notodromas monacha]CAG0915199.1 unnamed protein product [Notodromas monacha]
MSLAGAKLILPLILWEPKVAETLSLLLKETFLYDPREVKKYSVVTMAMSKTILMLALSFLFALVCGQRSNPLVDRCGCAKMLYQPEREARRVAILNECLTEHAKGKQFPGVPEVGESCLSASLQALNNLNAFASFMGRLQVDQRKQTDICYYTALGYRNPDGSANVEALVKDIEEAVEQKPGVLSDTFKAKMIDLARTKCDRKEIKKFYKCVYQPCIGSGRFPDI